MSDAKVGAYLWYPRDFAADEHVVMMTLAQEGAYRRLLDHQWLHGSIPAALPDLAKLCKNESAAAMKRLWQGVQPCFSPLPGNPARLANPKMERVRTEAAEYRESQRRAGRLGGLRTQSKNRAPLEHTSSEPSPSAQASVKLPSPAASPSPELQHTRRAREVRDALPVDSREAFDGLLRASGNPDALVGEIQMIGSGHRIAGATWDHVGAALRDHAMNATHRLTGHALRTFVKTAMAEEIPVTISARSTRVSAEDEFAVAIAAAEEKERANAR